MQDKEQENEQELHCCYAEEADLIMTEEIKKVLDEQSKEMWKEIEEKLFNEFIRLLEKCLEERLSKLAK